MADLLKFAEGSSITSHVREGVLFEREDGRCSFKAMSNAFLAKENTLDFLVIEDNQSLNLK